MFANANKYHLEITTYCNAACPQCPRNINGSGINPYLQLVHLPRTVIDQAFSKDICVNLERIFFCGAYGDPIMHPDFLDILRDFRSKNPTLWLYCATNGGARSEDFWSDLATILGDYGQVDFGIDGLEDTNHLYRRNVNWAKLMANVKSFISAGGRAQWSCIAFQHNEHQFDQIKILAKELGFISTIIRNTGRFLNKDTLEEMSEWKVESDIPYSLKPPSNLHLLNSNVANRPKVVEKIVNLDQHFSEVQIKCFSLENREMFISAEGIVLPCSYFHHNLYNARFYNKTNSESLTRDLYSEGGKNQVRSFLESYGLDNLNINYHSLSDILQNPIWDKLKESFTKELRQGRLFECAMACGTKITRVWD